jgi:hypothetical protein
MWEILETKNVTKCLKKIPKEILFKYRVWVEIVKNGGSTNLLNYPGFKDEKLKGQLRQCRSSILNIELFILKIKRLRKLL